MSLFYNTLRWGTEESFSSNRTAADLNSQERFTPAWSKAALQPQVRGRSPERNCPKQKGFCLQILLAASYRLHSTPSSEAEVCPTSCRKPPTDLGLTYSCSADQHLMGWALDRYCSQASKVGAERDLPIWAALAQPRSCFYFHAVGDWADIESSPFLANMNVSPMLTQEKMWNPINLVNSNHKPTYQ